MSCWLADSTSYDYQFRFVIVGDSTVGKSSLLKYFVYGEVLEECEPTVGVDFYIRTVDIEPGIRIKLQLWDTAGQERFRSITTSYFRNCAGVLLVFDITNRASFSHIPGWMNECRQHASSQRVAFILTGHKVDLEAHREISKREATLFADFHDMKYVETSSVDGRNIEEAFMTLVQEVHQVAINAPFQEDGMWEGIKKGHRVSVVQLKDTAGTLTKKNDQCC